MKWLAGEEEEEEPACTTLILHTLLHDIHYLHRNLF